MPEFSAGFRSYTEDNPPEEANVSGDIPKWLTGTLIRNGPGRFDVGPEPHQQVKHWFDGWAMLHRFHIDRGSVQFSSRFVQSPDYQQSTEEKAISFSQFATDPCKSIFKKVMTVFSPEFGHNTSVNVLKLDERFLAITESPMPVEFDLSTLETLGVRSYADSLNHQSTTAHPHQDRTSKKLYNLTTRFSRPSRHHFIELLPEGPRRRLLSTIKTDKASYMHSFGMTENYLILTEFPLVVDALQLLLQTKPFIENFQWEPDRGTRMTIIRKTDGSVLRFFMVDPFFSFHHINAFESEGNIVMDLCATEDASIIDELMLSNLRQPSPELKCVARPRRFTLPLDDGFPRDEWLSSEVLELPRFHYKEHAGHPYRYVYGISMKEAGQRGFFDSVIKFDVESRTHQHWHETGKSPGEPVFVPHPRAQHEDEGVLLSVVLDEEKERAFLLILDSQNLQELARAEVSVPLPFGFHGQFFQDNAA